MADKKLNEVPVVSDIVTIFGKRSNGEIVQIDKSNLATLLGGLIGIDSYIKDKKRKVVDANETPMNEFVFAYVGSTNLPANYNSGGLLTLGYMDGSSSSKLQFFFRENNVFKRIQWYDRWQNWGKIKTE